ncbi:DUF1798 family protein [Oceanobacillus halotolerans]|uniref:DUF1798 family protein n=1 Tax=Oceanobacillus halotolerans TaxID=2663380 RepID=UPI0013DA8483|nr:DUF1798 family protein [Oceanobacillus halotolerans]
MTDISTQTKQFKIYLDQLQQRFETADPPESRKDHAFFEKVKKETKPIYELLEEWEEKALDVVKRRVVNVHPQQVTSTKENMELLLMHSYYIDVKRKRYMELNHSIHYILDQLLNDLQ